jgi:hypothetical protein
MQNIWREKLYQQTQILTEDTKRIRFHMIHIFNLRNYAVVLSIKVPKVRFQKLWKVKICVINLFFQWSDKVRTVLETWDF